MKTVTITIDKKGDVTVELTGFHGKGCHVIQEAFEKALGKGVSTPRGSYSFLNSLFSYLPVLIIGHLCTG